jgi:uncharacterized ferritin-like protein (DUF455 family)
MTADPEAKAAAAIAVESAWRDDALGLPMAGDAGAEPATPVPRPGRPERPRLVAPADLPRRRAGSPAGHGALLHSIAHIEFNAIDLALDCVYRYRGLPRLYYEGWLRVAAEEAAHFRLMRGRLNSLGFEYGDFDAHNGLWEMACKTADDPLARMALVPRVLEARGLDATPPIMAKLRAIGDLASIQVLEVILRDEVGHVALGDEWFRYLCRERGLEPEATYLALLTRFDAPWPQAPLNVAARREAGFGAEELDRLARGRPRG